MTGPHISLMGKRRILIAVSSTVVLIVVALIFFFQRPPPPEPVYQGKPLSYWLAIKAHSYDSIQTATYAAELEKADEAIKSIDTNAIPALLELLRQKDSPILDKFFRLAKKQHFLKFHHLTAIQKAMLADQAFHVLSYNATPAIPELIKIYDSQPAPFSQQITTSIIAQMGPKVAAAIPFCLRAATNTNDVVRGNSLYTLGVVHENPQQVVPLLIQSLRDPSPFVVAEAATALGKFDQEALPAVPILIELLQKKQVKLTNSPPAKLGQPHIRTTGVRVIFSGGSAASVSLTQPDLKEVFTRALTHLDPTAVYKLNHPTTNDTKLP